MIFGVDANQFDKEPFDTVQQQVDRKHHSRSGEFFPHSPKQQEESNADDAFIKWSGEDGRIQHEAMFSCAARNWNSFVDNIVRITVAPEPIGQKAHPARLR